MFEVVDERCTGSKVILNITFTGTWTYYFSVMSLESKSLESCWVNDRPAPPRIKTMKHEIVTRPWGTTVLNRRWTIVHCVSLVWITLGFSLVLPLVLGLDAWVFSLHLQAYGWLMHQSSVYRYLAQRKYKIINFLGEITIVNLESGFLIRFLRLDFYIPDTFDHLFSVFNLVLNQRYLAQSLREIR